MELIVVCLLVLILILFIRGTTIREGARGRKNKSNSPSTTATISGSSTSTTATISGPSVASASNKATNQKHKSNDKHKNPGNSINKLIKKINSIENSQQKIKQSQQDIKQSQQEIKQTQSNMDSYYRDLSNNMLTQYTTYKNGFASEYDTKMNKINEGVNNAQTYSNSASISAAEAATSAAAAQASLQKAMEIEKNVFGKLSASIIQNDINSNNTVKEGLDSIYTKTTGNKTIFDLQNEVASAINDFYASYTAYLKCTTINSGSCSQTELTTKANTLETKIEALKAAYNTQGTSNINDTTFIANHNALIEQATRVRDLRSSIDQKYALKSEKEIMRDYNSSLYSGIGLSIAAVTLIYCIIRMD